VKLYCTIIARRLPKEPMATNRLVGKNIIITGATSGLGVDLAAALSAEGANVFIGGRRADLGAKVAKSTQSTFYVVDVADETSSRAFFLAAERHFAGAVASVGGGEEGPASNNNNGVVDYLFLNAGVEGDFRQMVAGSEAFSVTGYDHVFNVNVRGIVLGLQFGTRLLRANGSFVLTSSGASIDAVPSAPFYAASKAAVNSLARSFAAQFAASTDDPHLQSLSVVAINPLLYGTDMALRFTGGDDPSVVQLLATMVNPSQRLGKGSELAQLMLDFCLGNLPYKSGDCFVLDADTHFPLNEYHDRLKAVQQQKAAANQSKWDV
jgi:NAD(P)-dependent dehydrogenase (short-subunit alcohol dehydrogenase family)